MALINMTLFSNILNMDTEVAILLPENTHKMEELHPNKRYPVIYCLHGYRDNYLSWINRSTLYLEAKKHECIVVMPDCKNSFYANGENGFDYYNYVCKELPIKMANYFPISLERKDTFIMGASMGGYGAFLIAMKNPDKYAAAFSFSGALDFDYYNGIPFSFDQRMAKQVMGSIGGEQKYQDNYYLRNVATKLDKMDCEKPKFYAVCGTEDPLCYKYNENYYKFIKENTSLEYYYKTSSGNHDYYFWNQYIELAFKFFEV